MWNPVLVRDQRDDTAGTIVLVMMVGALGSAMLAGCDSFGMDGRGDLVAQEDAVKLLLPRRIKIEPFTRVKSFDEDEIPDGIEVRLRPLDRFGDPIKIVGALHFELYTYRKAAADRKGEQLQFWQVSISTPQDQRRYWDRTSQMYEFPLAWEGIPPPTDQCVLLVTYESPWTERLEDEYVLRLPRTPEIMGEPFGAGE